MKQFILATIMILASVATYADNTISEQPKLSVNEEQIQILTDEEVRDNAEQYIYNLWYSYNYSTNCKCSRQLLKSEHDKLRKAYDNNNISLLRTLLLEVKNLNITL